MKVIGARLWHEPSVVMGLAVSIILYFVIGGFGSAEDVAVIIAPFAASLGLRQFVTPTYTASANVPTDEGDAAPEERGDK